MPKLKKWDILDDFQTMCLTKIEFAQLSKFQSSNHHIHGSSWTSTSQFDQLFESMSSFATFQVPLQNSHRLKNNSQLESCEWSKKLESILHIEETVRLSEYYKLYESSFEPFPKLHYWAQRA